MITTSPLYQEILDGAHRVESRLLIGGQEFTRADIVGDIQTDCSIFREECPSVGNTPAASLTVSILTPTVPIPIQERIELQSRIVSLDEKSVSEWLTKGIYYVDTRRMDTLRDGTPVTMTITALDAMMFAEADFPVTGEWPKTDAAVLAEICEIMGVQCDSVLDQEYPITAPEAYTCRELLGYLGAMYGSSWTINRLGHLEMMPLGASRGAAGYSAKSVVVGDILSPITKVVVHKMDGNKFASGTDGRTLNVDCPWGSQAVADGILQRVAGYQYMPFTATDAVTDPATELGDITVDGIIYSIYSKMGDGLTAELSAPPEEEINHNYPFKSGAGGKAGRALEESRKNKEDTKKLVAEVDVAKAGVEASVKYIDLEDGEWIDAHTRIFSQAGGKRAAFDLWVVGESKGELESAAALVADAITLHGKVDVIGMLTAENGLKVDNNIVADGDIRANNTLTCAYGVNIDDPNSGITIGSKIYAPGTVSVVTGFTAPYISTSGGAGAKAISTPTGTQYFHPGGISFGTADVLVYVGSVTPAQKTEDNE